jgi:hypothetical protein
MSILRDERPRSSKQESDLGSVKVVDTLVEPVVAVGCGLDSDMIPLRRRGRIWAGVEELPVHIAAAGVSIWTTEHNSATPGLGETRRLFCPVFPSWGEFTVDNEGVVVL